MEQINYAELPEEQKRIMRQQMAAEDKARRESTKKLRDDYEKMKDDEVKMAFSHLQKVSTALSEEKVNVFNQFGALLAMKKELYNLTEEQIAFQQSHTFTSTDGRISVIIGSNVIDRWSDDVEIGVERINKWIDSKIENPEDRAAIRALMKTNKDGDLKANRILDLSKHANERGDEELIDAVNFIRDQYRPEKTSTYVKVKYKDEKDQWLWLALSMSAV